MTMLNLSRFKPRFWDYQDSAANAGDRHLSFRGKWLMIVVFTTVVTLTPILVMAVVDYRLTRQAFESEVRLGISRMVSNTWRNISHLLTQRRAVLAFIARDNAIADLTVQQRLETLLSNLQRGMDDFLDLAVLDETGTIRAYAGPYDPTAGPIIPAPGFKQAVADGFYIGDVTARPDKPHHLVVAVRHDMTDGRFFVLQSTLNAGVLDGPLSELRLDDGDDAFIINSQGILQTPAAHYGKRFSNVPLTILPTDKTVQVQNAVDQAGQTVLIGLAPIAASPFRLVMVRQESGMMDRWLRPRIRLIGFLVFSIILILISILGVATYMVNRIHASDQRRLQALHQVEYANKMVSIGRLASGVAHEVNNPLAIINQKAGLIKDLFTFNPAWAGNQKLIGLVDDVLASVRRCGAITRRLLDFSRHMESSLETVDIDAILRQVLAFMEKDAQRRCIAVRVNVSDDIPPFESDRGNLQQIFLNLINNAFAAMDEGGQLEITAFRQGDRHVCITVSDTGHGIPEADIKRVFEPFFSTGQGLSGTGLGLSVTYGMVSEMGGDITVHSQVNQGSRFTVTLPLDPPRAGMATACAVDLKGPPADNAADKQG
ncbi:two component system sensor histidine kinase [Desulfosarcina variabilis str. Montpellier]|uniref:sensor histidine kinase n=1 Tax=Desulfosarcina variabilis TaxID=2300 RepID=UPI003AFB00B7